MGISEREHHIKVLEKFLKETKGKIELYSENKNIDLIKEKEIVETLGYAISSLKTDLKYDLMYEGEEVYTKEEIANMFNDWYYTKDEVITMFTELKAEIEELWDSRYDVWLDNQYYIGKSDTLGEVDELIQQKINVLKGE